MRVSKYCLTSCLPVEESVRLDMVDSASVLMPYLGSSSELQEMLKIKNPGVNIKGEETYKEPYAQNKVDFKIKSEFKTSPAL